MIIDFHTHIFPEDIQKNREKYFPGEPAFKLLYSSPSSKMVSAGQLSNSMDDHKIDVSVVCGFPWQSMDTAKMHNDYIARSVQKHSGRLKGFCCVDPLTRASVFEAERALEAGLSGIGEIAFYLFGIDKTSRRALEPFMEICRKRDIPILIHTNEPVGHVYPGKTPNTLKQIYSIVQSHPLNKIVLAHWGGGIFFYSLLKKEFKETFKNVYFDTAASPFLYDPKIYKTAIEMTDKGRILFGSDFPLIKPERYFDELKSSGLSKTRIKNICGGNAKKLLGLDQPASGARPVTDR